jgi:general secretion pathway protein H
MLTSPAKISNLKLSAARQAGFTLMEIMIVITIIAGIMAIGAPILFNNKNKMKALVHKIAVQAREIHSIAKLENRTYRFVFSMPEEKEHSYWVESANGQVSLTSEAQEKDLSFLTKADRDDKVGDSPFKIEPRVTKEPVKFGKGLFIEGVEYSSKTKEISAGVAYVHFLPLGLVEECAIHITDRKTLNWTIYIHPLTGHSQVFEKKVSLKDITNR